MDEITRPKRTITRRTVLGSAGAAVLVGGSLVSGFLTENASDGEVSLAIDEQCSSASVEMRPPDGETWTGAVEYAEGAETVLVPSDGQTVTGGSTGSLQLSVSSSDSHVRRAFVVEGTGLEGPVVAEKVCGSTAAAGNATDAGCGSGYTSENGSSDSGGKSAEGVEVESSGDVEIDSSESIDVESSGDVDVDSSEDVEIESSESIDAESSGNDSDSAAVDVEVNSNSSDDTDSESVASILRAIGERFGPGTRR